MFALQTPYEQTSSAWIKDARVYYSLAKIEEERGAKALSGEAQKLHRTAVECCLNALKVLLKHLNSKQIQGVINQTQLHIKDLEKSEAKKEYTQQLSGVVAVLKASHAGLQMVKKEEPKKLSAKATPFTPASTNNSAAATAAAPPAQQRRLSL